MKSVFPSPYNLPVRYKIPQYHVIQILAQMKCKHCNNSWYASVSKSSVVLIEAIFDNYTWSKVFRVIRQIYDKENPKLPTKITELRQEL